MDKDMTPYVLMVAMVFLVALFTTFFGNGITGDYVVDNSVLPCLDSDSNNDYYLQGKISYEKLRFQDYCRNDKVYQYYCATSNTVRMTGGYECGNGCERGACLR